MLSSVLGSAGAVQMNILIIRAFVKMRELMASHKDLAARVEKLEANQKAPASVINILADEIDRRCFSPQNFNIGPIRRILANVPATATLTVSRLRLRGLLLACWTSLEENRQFVQFVHRSMLQLVYWA